MATCPPEGSIGQRPGGNLMAAIVQALSSTDAETEEWQLRCDMAAVFRIAARQGWNEHIGNHNSLMLPVQSGQQPVFLINPRGWVFQELTASSLIVCELDGTLPPTTPDREAVALLRGSN